MLVLDVEAGPGRVAGRRPGGARPAGQALALPARHDGLHRHRVLQAGDRRDQGARRRADRRAGAPLPDFDEPITINVNGCPNACARIQIADIGLKGQLVLDDDGDQVEGFQVHLGGALGLEAGFGRKVRGLKVTADELPDYVERVLAQLPGGARGRRALRRPGPPGPVRRRCHERASRAVLLPVLRRRGPAPAARQGHGAWECAACNRAFQLKFLGPAGPGRSSATTTEGDET